MPHPDRLPGLCQDFTHEAQEHPVMLCVVAGWDRRFDPHRNRWLLPSLAARG
jgi:hypothetical protein